MADLSIDATTVIRAANDAAPSSAQPGGGPSFGDHLSRARQSRSARPGGDDRPVLSQKAGQPTGPATTSAHHDGQDQSSSAAGDKADAKDAKDSKDANRVKDAGDAQPTDAAPQAAPPAPADKSAAAATAQAAAADASLKAAAQPAPFPAPPAAQGGDAGKAAPTVPTASVQAGTVQTETVQAKAQAANAAQAAFNSQLVAAVAATPIAKAVDAGKSQPAAQSASGVPQSANAAVAAQGAPTASAATSTKASQAALAAQTLVAAANASAANSQPTSAPPGQNAQDASSAAANIVNIAAAQLAAAALAPAPAVGDKSAGEKGGGDAPVKPAGDLAGNQSISPNPAQTPPAAAPGAGSLNVPAFTVATPQPGAAADDSSLASVADANRLRFVQRVARAFQAAGDNGGQVRLRLSPPELGSLQMNITVKDGVMTAHVHAETQNAQNLLLGSLPDLRDRLAQQDIRLERFDVDLSNQSPGGMPQTPNQQQNANDAPRRPAATRSAAATIEAAQPVVAAAYQGSGGLNVVI